MTDVMIDKLDEIMYQKRDTKINARIPNELKVIILDLAEKRHMTLTDYIIYLAVTDYRLNAIFYDSIDLIIEDKSEYKQLKRRK